MNGLKMKVTKEDKKILRKWKLKRDELEKMLDINKKGSWAYRLAKEGLKEMEEIK